MTKKTAVAKGQQKLHKVMKEFEGGRAEIGSCWEGRSGQEPQAGGRHRVERSPEGGGSHSGKPFPIGARGYFTFITSITGVYWRSAAYSRGDGEGTHPPQAGRRIRFAGSSPGLSARKWA
jgi:hypothetical protein